jgi:hypothetical protein
VIIAGSNKNCKSVMNGSTNMSIKTNERVEVYGSISDAVKSAESAMVAMKNVVKSLTENGLMTVRR